MQINQLNNRKGKPPLLNFNMLERIEISSLITCLPDKWKKHRFDNQNDNFEQEQQKMLKTTGGGIEISHRV